MHSRVEDPESRQALMFQVRGLISFEPAGGDVTATGTWFTANLNFFTVIKSRVGTPSGEREEATRHETGKTGIAGDVRTPREEKKSTALLISMRNSPSLT